MVEMGIARKLRRAELKSEIYKKNRENVVTNYRCLPLLPSVTCIFILSTKILGRFFVVR